MIVMESTADGVGTYFDAEYTAAADPTVKSQFEALFISWFQIEHYSRPFDSAEELRAFAKWLWENRNNAYTPSNREESGRYLWSLWERGLHWRLFIGIYTSVLVRMTLR